MSVVALYLVVTLALGLAAVLFRLPPLVGFLAAGFVLHAMGAPELSWLDVVADLGVTLLLFGIGLKLDLRTLLRREVWLTASAHMLLSVVVGASVLWLGALVGLPLLTGQNLQIFVLLAFALSFSSTVFVVKVLEERGETHSLYGRIAIGVLVIQDIAAVVFLTATSDSPPTPWALALLLLLPLARVLRAIWGKVGHGELQSLFGIVMALVPGYALFSAVGLKGDLGALVMGILLASHPAASELSRSLFHLKELLLVGFFVSIGFAGMPDLGMVVVAVFMLLLLPFKGLTYVVVLRWMRLRNRTGLLTGLSLTNYSEFGLIVVSYGVTASLLAEQWLVVLSMAVAASFVISALVNGRGHLMVEKLAARIPRRPYSHLIPEERPADAGDAEVVVIGMGRVGVAAYDRLHQGYGYEVLGVDYDGTRVQIHISEGRHVVEGDATDLDFWKRLTHSDSVRIAILAMPRHGANVTALDCLRESGFTGRVATVAHYQDEVVWAREHGVATAFNVYAGAGLELADQVARASGDAVLHEPEPSDGDHQRSAKD